MRSFRRWGECFARPLAVVLSVVLAFSLMPGVAWAQADGSEDSDALQTSLALTAGLPLSTHATGHFPLYGEAGTQTDPFQIRNARDLSWLSEDVAAGTTFSGYYFELQDDIDAMVDDDAADYYAPESWTPIGAGASQPFKGSFDGRDNQVRVFVYGAQDYAGLFGYIDSAYVHDVVVAGYVEGKSNVGGVVGYAAKTARIANAGSKVYIEAAGGAVGGVVGYADDRVTVAKCYNKAPVKGAGDGVGGIVGKGIVTDDTHATQVLSCYNLGEVTQASTGYYDGVGGIAGKSVAVGNSYNAGAVKPGRSQTAQFGAIAGYNIMPIPTDNDACYYVDAEGTTKAVNALAVPRCFEVTTDQLAGIVEYPLESGSFLIAALNVGGYEGNWVDASALKQPSPMLDWEHMAGTPIIVTHPQDADYQEGQTVQPLTVVASLPLEAQSSGVLSYAWYQSADGKTFKPIEGAAEAQYTPQLKTGEVAWYYCEVTDTYRGKQITLPTDQARVMVHSGKSAATPVFTTQPVDVTAQQTDTVRLRAVAGFAAGEQAGQGIITYQWYACDDAKGKNGRAIKGATANTYTGVDTSETATQYFYCVATNTFEHTLTATAISSVVSVTVAGVTVSSPADLLAIQQRVNRGETTYAGLTIKLTQDIDLSTDASTREWVPIGTGFDACFSGMFDGGGHTISGLSMTTTANYVGLFGHVDSTAGSSAGVRNLVVRGTINAAPGNYNSCAVAGIVGYAYGRSGAPMIMENVGNEVNVRNTVHTTGGLVGTGSYVRISRCYNKGAITGTRYYVGGIAFQLDSSSTVASCYNAGIITCGEDYFNDPDCGGIVGNPKGVTISNCVNVGAIIVDSSVVVRNTYGAIAGSAAGSPTSTANSNYWLATSCTQANGGTASVRNISVTAAQLAGLDAYPAGSGGSLLSTLNAGAYASAWISGDQTAAGQSYPALVWEAVPGKPTNVQSHVSAGLAHTGETVVLSATAGLPEAGVAGSDGELSFTWYEKRASGDATPVEGDAQVSENADGTFTATLATTQQEAAHLSYYCVIVNA